MNLKIADFYVRINGANFKEFDELFKDYITNEEPKSFDFTIDLLRLDKIEPPQSLTEPCRGWRHCGYNGGVCTMRFEKDVPYVRSDVASDGKSARVQVPSTEKFCGVGIWYIAFFAIGEAFSYMLLKNGCGVLHSSSIAINGSAVAFSAKSGTGKSTHTSIWKDIYPETVIVNDDTPIIRFKNGVPYLHGSPFAGSSGINTNVSAPLRAIVFLHRGYANKIEKFSGARAISYFVNEVRKPIVSEYMSLCMDFTEKLIKSTSVYLLTCTPEDEAVEVVKKELKI